MLNNKQLRFIDEYMIDSNASRAYVASGYSSINPDKNAYKLLKKQEIIDEIKKRQQQTSAKLNLTRESLIQDLIDIKDLTKSSFPPSAIKAIEVILKMEGWDKPATEITKDDDGDIVIKIVTKDNKD
jgi:phage terminase small subunit